MIHSPFRLNLLSTHHIGILGERLAAFIIGEKTNLISLKSTPYHGDLLLSNGLYIEVKTIRQGSNKKYQATVSKSGSQHIGASNFVLLQIIDQEDCIFHYIIPCEIIHTKRLCISSHPSTYQGSLSKYQDRFDLLIKDK